MKPFPIFLLTLGIPVASLAQEDASPQMETVSEETGIQGAIADGTPASPLPEKPSIDFNVLNSVTKRMEVVESPELPGLPAPQGTINMTVQLVGNPGFLPMEKPLPPQADVNDPAVQEQIQEAQEKFRETKILFVSASVYGGTKTLLKVYPGGVGQREVTVISNLDFNDYSGFATFQVKAVDAERGEEIRQYAVIMALGNTALDTPEQIAADHGLEVTEIPAAPAGNEPAFTPIQGEDVEALQAIADLHKLYCVEGVRMRTARISRERAYEERKAYLLANPPMPQDVTIRVWKRNRPQPQEESR